MRNTIYIVEFDGNKLLNGEFDFKEEAIKWAEDHISEKPIVIARDVEYSDEFGGEPIVHEEEELFHYPVEEVAEDKFDQEELEARLAEIEKDIPDEVEKPEEIKEDINSEIESVAANWDEVHEELKEEAEPIEEDVILFDPFGCDFSECEPMEVCKDEHRADCCDDICASPADFLRELAAELGIADEVEISEKECADGSCEEKHEDEIPCEDCKDEISEISDEAKVEEPVVVEDEVKVDVAPEAEVAAEEDIVPEEVKANEEPNAEVQVEDEKPAEETPAINISVETANLDADKVEEVASAITDAVEDVEKPEGTTVAFSAGALDDQVEEPVKEAICPECGKEICECGNKELVEKNKVTYTTGDPAIGDAHFNGAFEGGEGVSENLEENQVLTDFVQGEMAKGKTAEEVAETDEFIDLVKAEAIDELEEGVHLDEAQPEVDLVKVGADAKKMAAAYGKPVIYGYMGSDHHNGNRYFELDPIVCDDLQKCRKEVMAKYHPSGSILVAYPNKPFMGEELEEEMSDIEFAEALKKGLEEKHNCK